MSTLLESCREHQITGTIEIDTPYHKGVVELRAGFVDRARFGELEDDNAVRRLARLSEGMYTLKQQLPELSGSLGSAAQGEGDLREVSLVEIMRHCEDQALSCTITIVREFDRAEINYRVGELTEVILNGTRDDDAIVGIVHWPDGRFRVSAPPLALDIDGWPSATDPTAPFKIEHAAQLRPKDRPVPPPRSPRGTPPPLPGIAPTPAAPTTITTEKTSAHPTPLEMPATVAERPVMPTRLPALAQPLDASTLSPRVERLIHAKTDEDRGGYLLTALLGLLCILVITAWIAAIYYIQ